MSKQKYYVVWKGKQPGIYSHWAECKAQVSGVKGARYQSFNTHDDAEKAFSAPPPPISYQHKNKKKPTSITGTSKSLQNPPDYRNDTVLPLPVEVQAHAIAVDAACSGNPGKMEYRGVDLATGEQLFHIGPIYGTNNIGEFLAIVHGLALLKQQASDKVIYTDSHNAMLWIKAKKCKTKLKETKRTQAVFELIRRAEKWLTENTFSTPIIKWETNKWGEIPADFGRK